MPVMLGMCKRTAWKCNFVGTNVLPTHFMAKVFIHEILPATHLVQDPYHSSYCAKKHGEGMNGLCEEL